MISLLLKLTIHVAQVLYIIAWRAGSHQDQGLMKHFDQVNILHEIMQYRMFGLYSIDLLSWVCCWCNTKKPKITTGMSYTCPIIPTMFVVVVRSILVSCWAGYQHFM